MEVDPFTLGAGPRGVSTELLLSQLQQRQQSQTRYSLSAFHELCQKRRILPEYRFITQGLQFKATVELGRLGVFDTGENVYNSKKDAKDAVARVAYAALTGNVAVALENNQTNGAGVVSVVGQQDGVKGYEFVTKLNSYLSMSKKDPPSYTYKVVGLARFICEPRIIGHEEPFVSQESSSKREAGDQVAKKAWEWIESTRPLKNVTNVTVRAIDDEEEPEVVSFPLKVEAMCKKLGIAPPAYQLLPNEDAPAFFTGAAFFNHLTPRELRAIDGIGSIPWVYTKKAAKDAICINVLQELERFSRAKSGDD